MTAKSKLTVSGASRRFGFQLAPLVDLLLIVVFAQFLEVREVVTRDEMNAAQEMARTREELERLQTQLEQTRDDLQQSQTQAEQRIARSTKAIGAIAAAFGVPLERVAELDEWVGDEADELTPEVLRTAERVADASPEEVIRFLIGHAELLKRAEIWHLHADENRRLLLDAGDSSLAIRLERRGQDERTAEAENQLFAAYKQLPQPKGLVVILVSYSPAAVAGVYQPMIDALPKAVERMRTDLPATRFEYTVLGTTPLPDVLKQRAGEVTPVAPIDSLLPKSDL